MNMDFLKDFPSPDEIGLLKSENSLNQFFGDGFFAYGLSKKLSCCRYCSKVKPQSSKCFCSKGCYLESIGFLSELMEDKDKETVVDCLSYLSEFACKALDEVIGLQIKKEKVAKQEEKSNQESQRIMEQQKKLEEDMADFKEKKSHLGRPSNFENRGLSYAILWLGVEKKPSYRELAEKLGISVGQVYADLKALGYEKDEKNVQ